VINIVKDFFLTEARAVVQINTTKTFHHRGTEDTEDTEKSFVLLTVPQAQLTK